MDKQNYTLRGMEEQDLQAVFFHLKDELKKDLEAKILRRKRVLKSLDHLLTAITLYFVEQLSFQRLADTMAFQYGIEMSDTAWRKQFLKAAPLLLAWTQQRQESVKKNPSPNTVLGCSQVHAIDATDLPTQGGKATSRRIHTMFSVTEHRCVYAEVSDGHGGETLTRFPLRSDVLYLADRAYGRPPQLAYAIQQNAKIITRISPNHTAFFMDKDCQKKISFPSLLKGGAFSKVVYFKQKKKSWETGKTEETVYSLRLLGAQIPEEKQALAEKRVRRRASRKQRKLSENTLAYAKWLFLATTLSDSYTMEEILQTYRLRWQIELHFKRVKSFLNFRKLRRSCDPYKNGIVSLWLALSFLLAHLQLHLLCRLKFTISEYNAFSLVISSFS